MIGRAPTRGMGKPLCSPQVFVVGNQPFFGAHVGCSERCPGATAPQVMTLTLTDRPAVCGGRDSEIPYIVDGTHRASRRSPPPAEGPQSLVIKPLGLFACPLPTRSCPPRTAPSGPHVSPLPGTPRTPARPHPPRVPTGAAPRPYSENTPPCGTPTHAPSTRFPRKHPASRHAHTRPEHSLPLQRSNELATGAPPGRPTRPFDGRCRHQWSP